MFICTLHSVFWSLSSLTHSPMISTFLGTHSYSSILAIVFTPNCSITFKTLLFTSYSLMIFPPLYLTIPLIPFLFHWQQSGYYFYFFFRFLSSLKSSDSLGIGCISLPPISCLLDTYVKWNICLCLHLDSQRPPKETTIKQIYITVNSWLAISDGVWAPKSHQVFPVIFPAWYNEYFKPIFSSLLLALPHLHHHHSLHFLQAIYFFIDKSRSCPLRIYTTIWSPPNPHHSLLSKQGKHF